MMLKKGRSSEIHVKECSLYTEKVILPFGGQECCLAFSSSLQERYMDKLKNVQRRKERMMIVTENMATNEGGGRSLRERRGLCSHGHLQIPERTVEKAK